MMPNTFLLNLLPRQVSRNFSARDQRGNTAVRTYATALIARLPRESVLLTKGDLTVYPSRYVQVLRLTTPRVFGLVLSFFLARCLFVSLARALCVCLSLSLSPFFLSLSLSLSLILAIRPGYELHHPDLA
jgi:hypothetical protein